MKFTRDWFAFNLRLGDEWTIGPDLVGAAEQRVAAVTQVVSDRMPLDGATVLDLGCHEGGFGLELAAHGAHVTFVEGRGEHLEHARYAADVLGVDAEFIECDVRHLDIDQTFDVVLCLGLLYHLRGPDLGPFLQQLRGMCRQLLVCETQVAKTGRERFQWQGAEYRGRRYDENVNHPGASLDGETSMWLTRPSLVNLLTASGFTSVSELLAPRPEASYLLDDHVTLLASPGHRVPVRVAPPGAANLVTMPEAPPRFTHPAQGRRYRLRGRLAGSGKDFCATFWNKRVTPPV